MSVDPELLADLRNCNRGQTARLVEELYEALEAMVLASEPEGSFETMPGSPAALAYAALAKARATQ